MSLALKFDNIVIREYKSKDKDFLSRLSRLPSGNSLNSLKAYSFCNDYSIRRSMTQNGFIWVAEDDSTQTVIGGLCLAEKRLRIGGEERLFFYPFDAIVDPKYRNLRILKRLVDLATNVFMEHYDCKPIIYTSTAISNENMERFYNNSSMTPIVDQIQHAWKLDRHIHSPTQIDLFNNQNIKIWKTRDYIDIKKRFNKAFENYEMVPLDFEDLLLNKFWKYTYMAEYTDPVTNKTIEASISIWDQNKVSTLISVPPPGSTGQLTTNDISNHILETVNQPNQKPIDNFYQLFSCYTTQDSSNPKEFPLFKELLVHVHNDCLNMGVEYLFIGLAKTDPIDKYFPLLPGIKSLPFSMHYCLGNQEDMEILKLKDNPFYQDPRDYGILLLYNDDKFTARL